MQAATNSLLQDSSNALDDGSTTRISDAFVLLLAFPIASAVAPFQLFSFDTALIALCDVGIIMFSMMVIARALNGIRAMRIRMDVPMVALILFLFVSFCSVVPPLVSGNPEYMLQYVKSTAHFLYMWLFAVCCAATVVRCDVVIKLFQAFVVCAIPVNVFGIYQVPARFFDWPFAWIEYTGAAVKQSYQLSLQFEGFFRATSIFSEPSALAMYTMTTAIMLLVPHLFYNVRLVKNRFLFYASLYTCFIAMFLTFSLTIVLQFGAFLIAVALLSRASTIKKLLTMFAAMATLFVVTNLAISTYAGSDLFSLYFQRIASNVVGEDKVEGTMGDSFGVRADAQKTAVSIWRQNPVFGAGFGCLGYVRDNDGLFGVNALQMYFFSLATTGTLGGLLIVIYSFGFSYAIMRLLIQRQRERSQSSPPTAEDMALAIAAFLCCNEAVHGLSSDDLILQYHWVVMGVVSLVYYHPSINSLVQLPVITFAAYPRTRVSWKVSRMFFMGKEKRFDTH